MYSLLSHLSVGIWVESVFENLDNAVIIIRLETPSNKYLKYLVKVPKMVLLKYMVF